MAEARYRRLEIELHWLKYPSRVICLAAGGFSRRHYTDVRSKADGGAYLVVGIHRASRRIRRPAASFLVFRALGQEKLSYI